MKILNKIIIVCLLSSLYSENTSINISTSSDFISGTIELDRNKVYISNVVPWRPPDNRQTNNEEILQCLPFIQRHIELVQPKF